MSKSQRKNDNRRVAAHAAWLVAALAAGSMLAFAKTAAAAPPDFEARIHSGELQEANAEWWGFQPEDATACLQAAIDSGAARVVVPYMGADWVVTPIRLRGYLELTFEPGVVVQAKQGEFKGKGDSLFSAADESHVKITGYGATLRMRKQDYQNPPYEPAEWRMTLSFTGCTDVQVEGLRLESSGGDGIYIGASAAQPYCRDVVIRNVLCLDHHRQGISVITAENLLIENCLLSGTRGTAPQAGIDLEPNGADERLVNCVIRNCLMEDNAGAGMLVYLKPLTAESLPVSIRFENCCVKSGADQGMAVGAVRDGLQGSIEFVNCTVENTARGGAFVYDKSADGAVVRFLGCKWGHAATAPATSGPRAPLLISLLRASITDHIGGIEFQDCVLYDGQDRPGLVAECDAERGRITNVCGNLLIQNPFGARVLLEPAEGAACTLTVSPASP